METAKKFTKLILYTIFFPIWICQRLSRRKNIWIFGAWYGRKFSDNSKYLFDYIINQRPNDNIRAIWITRNKEVLHYLKEKGHEVYMARSFKAIYYTLQSEIIFVSSGKRDVNALFSNGAKWVQLWHGSPLKRIGLDDEYAKGNDFFERVIVRNIAPYHYEYNYNYTTVNSGIFRDIFSSAFRIDNENVLEIGSPRNDVFFKNDKHQFNRNLIEEFGEDCKLIYYLPTFRESGTYKSMFELPSFKEEEFSNELNKHNIVFVYKGHFVDSVVRKSRINNVNNKRFVILSDSVDQEVSEMYKDADVLITDYSSVLFDFLLTEKPIIFASFDLDDYLKSSRKMYFEYESMVPGPIVGNWKELYDIFDQKLWVVNKFQAKIQQSNLVFNKYHDNKNSSRLYNLLIN